MLGLVMSVMSFNAEADTFNDEEPQIIATEEKKAAE